MADDTDRPALPATGWAVLGLLSFGRELSGYDLKKWSDRSLGFFYWSPSFSQIYGELRRLEKAGYASSRRVSEEGRTRDKRVYRITGEGLAAVRAWAREAPVDPPVLKHGPMLRLWLGHLLEPEQLRELLARQREYAEGLRERAAADLVAAEDGTDRATHPVLALRWAERYYASERDLAAAMLDDIAGLGDDGGVAEAGGVGGLAGADGAAGTADVPSGP
ncbi:PadR family transcriptional regulator [Streptomyces sp. NPDC044571]|uniref:PadR family transcriptional regulator n=1 Tax=Streptomyces sp. NPDC044571 TaxID=3155371 RepID=UPI0034006743